MKENQKIPQEENIDIKIKKLIYAICWMVLAIGIMIILFFARAGLGRGCLVRSPMRATQSATIEVWELPPCCVDPDDGTQAAKLLRKMLAAGVSRFHPDPLAELEEANTAKSR